MNPFFRYYNKNREAIWFTLLVIVIIIVVIHLVNFFVKNRSKDQQISVKNDTVINVREERAKRSSISNTTVSNETYKKESNIIDKFIGFCNDGKTEQAYALLTDECKEILYPTLDYFKENYIKKVYPSRKEYTIKNYYGNTYTIRLTENMLSTGKSSNAEATQDYFTIVDNKLNINEYLGRYKMDSSGSSNGINIKILYKDVFMDYEKYSIEVYNGSSKTIRLDSLESTKSIYLKNSNDIEFPSYSHELIDTLLEVPQGSTRKLDIKFMNKYVTTNEIEELTFSDIILDSDAYKVCTDKSLYKDRTSCTIEM